MPIKKDTITKPKATKPSTSSSARTVEKKVINQVVKPKPQIKRDYIYAVGKRKTAVARVRLYVKKGDSTIVINEQDLNKYFPVLEFQQTITSPLELLGLTNKYKITVKVVGGGKRGQAEAVRHGISRALLKIDETYRKTLRGAGFLTRDARRKERKKPGLKRARRAPQWAKR